MSYGGKERRRSARAPLRVPIRLTKRPKDGECTIEAEVVSENISLHGAYFLVDTGMDLSPGETIDVKVLLSIDSEFEQFFQNLSGTARVVRVEPLPGAGPSFQPHLKAVAIDFCRPLGFRPFLQRSSVQRDVDIEGLFGFREELEKVRRLREQVQALSGKADAVVSRCQTLVGSIEGSLSGKPGSGAFSQTCQEILNVLRECATLVTGIQEEMGELNAVQDEKAATPPSAEGTPRAEVTDIESALRESELSSLREALCACGAASEESMSKAVALHEDSGRYIGAALIELGLVTEHDFLASTVLKAKVPYVSLRHCVLDQRAVSRVPRRLAEKYAVVPFDLLDDSVLLVAMANPSNDSVRRLVCDLNPDVKVRFVAASVSDVIDKLEETTALWPVSSA